MSELGNKPACSTCDGNGYTTNNWPCPDCPARTADDLLSKVLPQPFEGYVYAVYKTDCADPQHPLAVFGYKDWAEGWARKEYGVWKGLEFKMNPAIQIREIAVVSAVQFD